MMFNKKLIISAVAVMSLGLNTACTDSEVAFGSGAALGAIGGIAIANREERYNGRRVCHSYRDYYGYWRTECRRSRWGGGWNIASNTVDATAKTELSAEAIAREFGMPYASADGLVNALKQSANGNHKYVKDLGLSDSDASRLAKKKIPSNHGIKTLAKSLGQEPSDTKVMISRIVERM